MGIEGTVSEIPNHYFSEMCSVCVHVHRTATIVLVAVVLLAGCSGLDSTDTAGPETSPETDIDTVSDTPQPTTTTESTTTTEPTATKPTTAKSKTMEPATTARSNTGFTPPKPPTSPEEKFEDRIASVEFIHKEAAASGNGHTNFDVLVRANTTMGDVDPKPDVDGEPYFYVTINGKGVSRDSVTYENNGTFGLEIPPNALEQFDSGTLTVKVLLLDVDHKHDDMYDEWSGTIRYSPS